MTKQEIALQLTLKMLEQGKCAKVQPKQGMTTEDFNKVVSEHVAIIFNTLVDNLTV